MSFFLMLILAYTLMHAVVFWGIFPLIRKRLWLIAIICVLMAVMTVAPMWTRLLENGGYESAARVTAWSGYTWQGFIFLAFSCFAVFGLWEIMAFITGYTLLRKKGSISIRGRKSSAIILSFSILVGLYGFYEAANLQIERVELQTELLPQGSKPIKVALVSDLHLGLIIGESRLNSVIHELKQLNPDIIVASGDIVDAQINHIEELSTHWHRLNPPLGKFAVIGNHEYYAGLANSVDYLEKSGFTILRNTWQQAADYLAVAGIDDPATGNDDNPADLIASIDPNLYTILLKHRPTANQEPKEQAHLQLSGHSHRGQIFPFSLITKMEYPMQDGLFELSEGKYLYTSRGTGTWGPPIRVGSPAEITLIEISPKDQ